MKKTTDFSPFDGSAMVAGMVSEMIAGAITGVASVRRLFYRTILVVAIAVAAVSFTIGMMFHDYLYGKPIPVEKRPIPAAEPVKPQEAKPPPTERNDPEDLQQLIRKDPL